MVVEFTTVTLVNVPSYFGSEGLEVDTTMVPLAGTPWPPETTICATLLLDFVHAALAITTTPLSRVLMVTVRELRRLVMLALIVGVVMLPRSMPATELLSDTARVSDSASIDFSTAAVRGDTERALRARAADVMSAFDTANGV